MSLQEFENYGLMKDLGWGRKGGGGEVMGIRHNFICVQGSQNLDGKINTSLLSHNLQLDKVFPPCHII